MLDVTGAGGSVGRRDRYPHAQTLARIIVQSRHVDFAAIAVFHVVTDDPALLADHIDLLTLGLGGAVVAAMVGDPVADGATGNSAHHRRCRAAVTLAHGVAQHATNHRAKDGTYRAVARIMLHYLLVVALLLRNIALDHGLHRIGTQHIRPAIVGIVIAIRGPPILRKSAGNHQGRCQCSNP